MRSTASPDFSQMKSLTPDHSPVTVLDARALGDRLVRAGGIELVDAFASSQLYAPHKPERSGVTTQMWLGAKLWHSEHE